MVKSKDGDGIKSSLIIVEVQKRPCLYDSNNTNYGDRSEKMRSWKEVYECVVPGWSTLGLPEKVAAGKEVQKRWRSIRDSYTKAYRQGKCPQLGEISPSGKRYQYHKQMAFLLRALQNKKPRYAPDKYETFSDVSSSPQLLHIEDLPRISQDSLEKPLDLKPKVENQKPECHDKECQVALDSDKKIEITIDVNSILPDDHFKDDKLFMNSLLPLFKKMSDDTRLLCRIEVLKIIRYALQGHKYFEDLKMAEDNFFKNQMCGILAKESGRVNEKPVICTRSAEGGRPVRKRRTRTPSPHPAPAKKRGPGRPRKIRPVNDFEEERFQKKRLIKPKLSAELKMMEPSDEDTKMATTISQLSMPTFMKMLNLERCGGAEGQVKTEPRDPDYS